MQYVWLSSVQWAQLGHWVTWFGGGHCWCAGASARAGGGYGKQAGLQLAWEWHLRLFVKVSLVDIMAEDAHPHPVEQIAKSFGRKLFKDVSQAYASS
jgi:hypothetical protein